LPERVFEGGCFCGQVRYRAEGAPHRPHYCHCRMCQRLVGAPTTAWVNFPAAGFAFTTEEPAYFHTSPGIACGFCPRCGSSLCSITDGESLVCVSIASLDDPDAVTPGFHMWTSSQRPWLRIDDDLPRWPEFDR
jgi:hypothetical protein